MSNIIQSDGVSFVADTGMNILKIFRQKLRPIVAENYEEYIEEYILAGDRL